MHRNRLIEPPAQIVQYLIQAGFYGAARISQFDYDPMLISALVERWRPETHTFHTTRGECTITLQDVAIQLGLRCEGLPVIGRTDYTWAEVCEWALGIIPPEEKISGQALVISWLDEHFHNLPDDANEEQIQQFTRAYILRLIGGYLMPDRSGQRVYLMYLPLLGDLELAGQYSWGSAVLAHLYRELCNATDVTEQGIGGCMTLLHLWAWDRFPMLAPQRPLPANPHVDIYPLMPPLGFRWKNVGQPPRPSEMVLHHYRKLLDEMGEDDIVWQPYESQAVQQLIPGYCFETPQIWLASVPLISFHIIEWHHADRVLRQFGRQQPIPVQPFFLGNYHTIQLRGRTDTNWVQKYSRFIQAWSGWQNTITESPMAHEALDRTSEYMRWYWRHTRRWIHPTSAATGFAVDVADELIRLSIQDPLQMPIRDFQDRVAQDQRNIKIALKEQHYNMVPQSAPPTIDLPRPLIPQGRPSKRRGGYLSTQPPVVFEHEEEHQEEQHQAAASSSDIYSQSYYMPPSTVPQCSSSTPNQFGSFMSFFESPTIFATEYNNYTFDTGGPSNEAFMTPQQLIPPIQSPQFDLNTPSVTPTNEPAESQHEDPIIQRRPQRVRRKPTCGTGSHYE